MSEVTSQYKGSSDFFYFYNILIRKCIQISMFLELKIHLSYVIDLDCHYSKCIYLSINFHLREHSHPSFPEFWTRPDINNILPMWGADTILEGHIYHVPYSFVQGMINTFIETIVGLAEDHNPRLFPSINTLHYFL